MTSPVVTITSITKRGKRVNILADYTYDGTGAVACSYELIDQSGTLMGPYTIDITTPGKIDISPILGEGLWKINLNVAPQNGVDTPTKQEAVKLFRVVRGFVRLVFPQVGGAAGSSAKTTAADLNGKLQKAYSQAAAGAVLGAKRQTAADKIVELFGITPLLRIFRNNEEIIRVKYAGYLAKVVDSNGDVVIKLPTLKVANTVGNNNIMVYKAADLATGVWRFSLQGYGDGSLNEILGSVGGPNSGKQLILSESPNPGCGFSPDLKFILPRAMDGLT